MFPSHDRGVKWGNWLAELVEDPDKAFQNTPSGGQGGGLNGEQNYRDWLEGEGMTVMEKIFADIETMFGNIGKFFNYHLIQPIADAFEELATFLSSAWDGLVTWFTEGLAATVEVLAGAWDKVVGFIVGIGEGASSFMTNAWYNIAAFIMNAGTDAASWVTARWEEVTKFFSILGSDSSGS